MQATCPIHLIFPDLIMLITLGEQQKLYSSSLCSFLEQFIDVIPDILTLPYFVRFY
jgi:hypothetical protein